MLNRYYKVAPQVIFEETEAGGSIMSMMSLRRVTLSKKQFNLIKKLNQDQEPLDVGFYSNSPESVDFLEKMVYLGLLEADYTHHLPYHLPMVEVLIPIHNQRHDLGECLYALARQTYPRERFRVKIVDCLPEQSLLDKFVGTDFDGLTTSWQHLSADSSKAEALNAASGILHNRKIAQANSSPLLAFLDGDCIPDPDWLEVLVSVLEDPLLDAVSAQTKGISATTFIECYLDECSTFNMGSSPSSVGLGSRCSHVPGNLLIRREVFEHIGGFHHNLKVDPTIDFSWRMLESNHRIFYYPRVSICKKHGSSLWNFAAQRIKDGFDQTYLRRSYPLFTASPPSPSANFVWAICFVAAITGDYAWLVLVALVVIMRFAKSTFKARRLTDDAMQWLYVANFRVRQEFLTSSHTIMRNTLSIWPFLLIFGSPQLGIIAVVMVTFSLYAEWSKRRPQLRKDYFILGYLLDCFFFSVGHLGGEIFHTLFKLFNTLISIKKRTKQIVFSWKLGNKKQC